MQSTASFLLDLAPREVLRLVRRRFFPGGPAWTVEELLARSSKHRQGLRLIDTLLRWSQITSRVCGCDLVALAGRRVLEIGCGPLGGFGPVALFLGARSFDAVDPELDPQIFAHPRVEDAYLGGLYADLVAVYGPRMERSAFIEAVRRDLHAHRAPLAEAKLADGPDVVLSISCLEHVFPLASVATVLEKLGGDRLTQLHLVDFSNHYPTKTPFEGLYSQPPNDYIASRGAAINLARPKDVAGVFRMHNMPFTVAMVRPGLMSPSEAIHPWWTERYTVDELGTHLVLFAACGRLGPGR